jgi:H+-transporting ATPase
MRACWKATVEVDQSALTGESLPENAQARRRDILRFDHPPRRDRRAGLCHRREHLFRQDRGTGAVGRHRQPFSEGGAEDRQLPDHAGGGLVAVIIAVAIYRGDPILTTLQFALVLTVAAIPVAMPTVLSVTMAVGARLLAKKTGDRQQAGGDRGIGRRGRAVRRQDRHPDPEQADPGRSVLFG